MKRKEIIKHIEKTVYNAVFLKDDETSIRETVGKWEPSVAA